MGEEMKTKEVKAEEKLAEMITIKEEQKRIKNLIALAILLTGLFGGSLFVDAIQMVRGKGYVPAKLANSDIFSAAGKSWVAYPDPIVKVQVFSDETCQDCQVDEVLVWLKKIVPTVVTEKVDVNSDSGKKLAAIYGIKTIPGLVFSEEIDKTDFFEQAAMLFEKKNNVYIFKTAEVGIPVGKYIESPKIQADDIKIGPDDAKVKIVEFSDFQCPYCKNLHPTIEKIIADYGNEVQYVYKNFPLDFHPQAGRAALAGMCANEQGKFMAYSDKLFATQSDWGKALAIQKFKLYARQIGLDSVQFNKCLDDEKYADKIEADIEEGKTFGIAGTPAIFINGQFKNGAVPLEELKAAIDAELAK